MCGIIGVASTNRIDVEHRGWLDEGLTDMAHRGPDDSGVWWTPDGRVGLGHRRLAILDVSSLGHQPMFSSCGSVAITFNGEIYNFKELRSELAQTGSSFRTGTDTEVIIHAYLKWGSKCVARLKGMFSFAIFDSASRKVVLCRDRAGEKPMYYRLRQGEIRFSSELKGLLADPHFERELDYDSLDCLLTIGYIPGKQCILKGVRKLPAGHALEFDLPSGIHRQWQYWSLPELVPGAENTAIGELDEQLEELLSRAVSRQLVADVPVGLLLSGGVDSSLVTAMAARNTSKLQTFTVGFKDFERFDETKHASLVANYFGTSHTILEADAVSPDLLPRLAHQYDEPMFDSSVIPTFLVSEKISRHCKVALGGDGGDELFGGYYSASRMALLQQISNTFAGEAVRSISKVVYEAYPSFARGSDFLRMLRVDAKSDLPLFAPKLDRARRANLGRGRPEWHQVGEELIADRTPSYADALQRITRFDFCNYMAEDILVKLDRASMLNSLEIRSPFLDVDLVEFAFSKVPSSLKARPLSRKILLKRLAARILPPGFDLKRKQGFGIPLGHWLQRGQWRTFVEEVLLDQGCMFDRVEVQRILSMKGARHPMKEQLFGLTLFELWRRDFRISI